MCYYENPSLNNIAICYPSTAVTETMGKNPTIASMNSVTQDN